MNDQTLEQFLLSVYKGLCLKMDTPVLTVPNTVLCMIDPLDVLLSEGVCFRFKQELPSLHEIGTLLMEYYVSIHWNIDLDNLQPGQEYILGSVYPAEIPTCLALICFFKKEDPDVLVIATNPLLP